MLTPRTIACGVGVCLCAISGVAMVYDRPTDRGGASLTAIATHPRPSLAPMSIAQASTPDPSRLLQERIQQDLANRLNVEPNRLQLVEITAQTWPDRCLGLARPYERCRGGEVKGWRVTVASPQQMWTYRSDRNGQRLKLEPLPGAPDFGTGDFSIDTSRRLRQIVAEQVGVAPDQLQVLEVQSATWDGCLGVYQMPDQACTMIALSGFRTLVTDGKTTWVYHLNENGEQIAYNAIASGAQAPVNVSFVAVDSPPEELDAQIVFQSQLSGDLAGSVQRTVLMADGKLYREQSAPLSNSKPTRTLIKTLSVKEVEAFQAQLAQQLFFNLNRMRYLTQEAFADYPTIRLQTPSVSVEYIDLAIAQLPPNLQQVIAQWEVLSQPEEDR